MALLCLSSRYQNIWYAVWSYSSSRRSRFCLATLVFSSRRSLLPLAFALRSSSLALVESYRTIIEQRTKGEKTRSQTLITASYLLFVDFHIDCQPPRWSSLVTFDGQRLPRWSSSSRFVVDCQPLDLPHQLLTSRDFLFAILLSTASFLWTYLIDFSLRDSLSTANFLWTYLIDFSLCDLFGLACRYLNRATPSLRRPTRSLRRLSLTLVHLFV